MTAKNPEPIIMGILLQPNRFNEGKNPFNPTLFEMEIQKKKKERETIFWASRGQRGGCLRKAAAAAAASIQSCPTLCDPINGSPPGSPVPGILQARTLEWVAISFSNAWKWKAKVKTLSRIWFLATPWTAAHQAPPSMGFSKQEYWSGLPLPSPSFPFYCFPLLLCGCDRW